MTLFQRMNAQKIAIIKKKIKYKINKQIKN